MDEGNSFSKDIAGGVRGALDRIGEFFHLFDLSFFVSGTTTFTALFYWSLQQGMSMVKVFTQIPGWMLVIIFVVACYVCGLLSFASGRMFASLWRRGCRQQIVDAIRQHGVASQDVLVYLSGPDRPWRLYERLWVDIRESPRHAGSFSVLNRYWVMAATYDGLAMSSLVWLLTLIVEPPLPWDGLGIWFLLLFVLASTVIFFVQGRSYHRYQALEVVATLVASTKRLIV